METIKIILSTILTVLLVGFVLNTINVDTAKANMTGPYYTGIKECPSGYLVIRCEYGGGDCTAEDQYFCDEMPVHEQVY
jgi:hypothetical protein